MANRTVKDATSVKGTNPQYLVEKIIRTRIYECRYWKEECFALTAELMVDKAMELKFIGGVYGGNIKPTPFLCLLLKMLQIQPEKDIVVEFIRNENFKYVRALGATYMRLVGTSIDCYKYLEPLYYDYRKMKKQNKDGGFVLIHMDEFIDELNVLEENNQLEPRVSALEEDLEDLESSGDEEMGGDDRGDSPDRRRGSYRDLDKSNRSPSPRYRRSPSPHSRQFDKRHGRDDDKRRKSRKHRHEHRSKDDDKHRKHKEKDKDRDRDRDRHREKRSKRDNESDSKGSKDSSGNKDLEIEEANKLRASLGLPPLK
ncbi:hypothetical protein KUTeg_016668 [Tegillarca granosa]|uniref:Pre-mRNA-splicing factor 38 n=1 Tax=Tegillarca granosa TaxID=220873 RepID=A0ABQ9ELJ0_TEGGR|nr:hypothetical protein KUTeg_016668 [Tegillarca granosa]